MKTELRIDGANCPICLGELVDELRHVEGVESVTASIAAGCVVIEHAAPDHAGPEPGRLIAIVRSGLHGVALSGNETVMTQLDPTPLWGPCRHVAAGTVPTPSRPPGRAAATPALAPAPVAEALG
jgi:copper chaperone CopZ